jgi:hypothetical protein
VAAGQNILSARENPSENPLATPQSLEKSTSGWQSGNPSADAYNRPFWERTGRIQTLLHSWLERRDRVV